LPARGDGIGEEITMARILIAEDEEALRGFVQRALADIGHDVAVAADGAEALDLLTRAGRFDLLLADIKMPVMDGIALALAAARDHPDLVILLMTGYADQRERAHGLDALIHDVITKPFTLAEIRVAVASALGAAASRRG
jgi:CheY-like chemotaxis protein